MDEKSPCKKQVLFSREAAKESSQGFAALIPGDKSAYERALKGRKKAITKGHDLHRR